MRTTASRYRRALPAEALCCEDLCSHTATSISLLSSLIVSPLTCLPPLLSSLLSSLSASLTSCCSDGDWVLLSNNGYVSDSGGWNMDDRLRALKKKVDSELEQYLQ